MNSGFNKQRTAELLEHEGVEITKLVMTFSKLSPPDKQAVGTRVKGFGDKDGIHSAGAHDSDDPDVRRVLESGHTRGIGRRIAAPVAEKAQNFWFKWFF